jgi:hypothetical protein
MDEFLLSFQPSRPAISGQKIKRKYWETAPAGAAHGSATPRRAAELYIFLWGRRRTGHETSRQLSRIPTPTSDRDKAGRRSFVPGPMPRPPQPRLPPPIKTPQPEHGIDGRIEPERCDRMLTSFWGNRRRCAPPGDDRAAACSKVGVEVAGSIGERDPCVRWRELGRKTGGGGGRPELRSASRFPEGSNVGGTEAEERLLLLRDAYECPSK